ncbi:unnamed protein product [Rotaria sp. Silwood2]|nr:unnamed protein product [Rotaria sp. Silwood2]
MQSFLDINVISILKKKLCKYLQDSSPTAGGVLGQRANEFDGLLSTPTTNRENHINNNHLMKNIIETKKLQQAIQILKIELNQRDLLIQNQKIHYEEKCEELQEKLADMTYQKQLLQTKLDSQLQIDRELALRSQDEVRQQLSQIMERQHQLEDVNKRLIAKSNEIRHNLHNKILPTDEEYRTLKSTNINSEQMSLKDFIMIKFYETVRPLETEIDNLRRTQNILDSQLAANGQDLIQTQKIIYNRTFQHGRDEAIVERDRHIQLERDLQRKYDELLNEYRQYQSTTEVRLGELQSELKLKTFEFDRLKLLYEENLKSLKTTQNEIEKLQKKNDLIQKEYFNLQVQSDRRLMEIDTELNEKRTKLQVYEKVEQELDEVVMQAAQVENDGDANKILFSYGYGASLPTSAKRRLQHSVHLAKRVIQLEQANTSLRLELDRERKKKTDIHQELENANRILDQAQQPYDFLIATVRNKDAQLKKIHDTIEQLEKQLRECENERQSLIKTNNQLTKDIEKLLEYQEPLKVMKNVIMNLHHQDPQKPTRRTPSPPLNNKYRSITPPTLQSRRSVGFVEQLDQHHNPPPMVFTSTSTAKSPSTKVIRGPPASQQGKYRKIYKVTNN